MRRLRALFVRIAGVFGGSRSDADIDDELQLHLALLEEDHRRAGMDGETARRAARAECGSLTAAGEAYRERRGLPAIETLWRDVRYGMRVLGKTPGFTAAAVISLGLGIGANTTIFQLLDAVSFRGLPVAAPHELVEIRAIGDGRWGRQSGRNRQVSAPIWWLLRDQQKVFSGLFAFGDTRFNLAPTGEIRPVEGLWVSGSFFPVLGITPELGRLFTAEEDRPGCGYFGAVISHALWQRQFGGRADVIGQTLHVDGEIVPVLGVTPASFFGVEVGRRFDVALPLCSSGFELRDHFWLGMMGRLAPGTTLARANDHLASLGPGIFEQTLPPGYRPDRAKRYQALRLEAVDGRAGVSPLRAQYARPLWVLMAIAVSVLLDCRDEPRQSHAGARRGPRAGVRLASRHRRIAGAAHPAGGGRRCAPGRRRCGAGRARRAMVGRRARLVDCHRRGSDLSRSAAGLAHHRCRDRRRRCRRLAVALAPAIRAANAPALVPLSGRGTASAQGRIGMRKTLVAVQVGLSFVLVFAAGLFARSFQNLTTGESGFRADSVLVSHVFFPESELPPEPAAPSIDISSTGLRAIPGTLAIASSYSPPLSGQFWNTDVKVGGVLVGVSNLNQISPDYFRARRRHADRRPRLHRRGHGGDEPRGHRDRDLRQAISRRWRSPRPIDRPSKRRWTTGHDR